MSFELIVMVVGQCVTAAGIYAAIRADLARAIERATHAEASAHQAHQRIDQLLQQPHERYNSGFSTVGGETVETLIGRARAKATPKPAAKKSVKPPRKEKQLSDEEFLATLKPETRDWLNWLHRTFGKG